MTGRAAVILAAGKGERMKSPLAKVLHKVGARTLLDHAIDTAETLGCQPIVVVVGAQSADVASHVRARLGEGALAIQDPPLGTGHAVLAARDALDGFAGHLAVIFAADLLDPAAGAELFHLVESGADLSVQGFEASDPAGYGRMVIDASGGLERIVEANDASPEELRISLCNSGMMAADCQLLLRLLERVGADNAKGEYYLTSVIGLARAEGKVVRVAMAAEADVAGVNSQAELAHVEAIFQHRRRAQLMAAGVAMTAPETVHLSWDTVIGAGAMIEPYVIFGPRVAVEGGATIRGFSHLEGAIVRAGAIVGPYARLRPGAVIGENAHIGNFVEVKKVRVGAGAKANHLAYLGDGEVGAGANIGAGTIFCNYDGFDKFETFVGERAFIGSNSALVAPVRIGPGAYTGSGSVITTDVAADALALGRAAQVEKPGWARAFRARKTREKAGR
ncbi:MAG TPA: bifunctional UDP-N-acetylglucosamine diphosphorylase/glucosamine-1-phosphate N-acetyltransferase GlmU [Caulobacteraceae bacterium]|nr:bifunctional UDP-N-acetylglucosamine diphosphorylase/glucosamine-1-phosphate N-acetyltransferase GlmU [Caulobacteraceae bacterium]